jgi:DNA-binding LacI/PurR family transcriptional regulator
MADDGVEISAHSATEHSASGQPSSERRSPTIDDIAELTRVHRSTVSRALSRPDLVSAETRRKVEQAALTLGYRANPAARSLATGRSGLIGLVVPDSFNGYFNLVLKSAQHRARANGLSVIVAETEYLPGTEVRAIEHLSQHVDGVICSALQNSYETLTAAAQGATMVFIGEHREGFLSVSIDESIVMQIGLDHLYNLGHRRIALVGGQPYFGSWEARRAYKDIWDKGHVDCDIIEIPGFMPHLRDGAGALKACLVSEVSAVMAYSDALAIGMMLAGFAEGIRFPRDLSLLGVDDVSFASLLPGGLSTISLNVPNLGELAVDVLLGNAAPHTDGPPPRLVARGSTAAPLL